MLYNEQEIYEVGNSINQRFKKAKINIPKIKGLKLKHTLYEKLKRKSPTTAKIIKNITLIVGCTFGTIIGAIVGIVAIPIIVIVKYERDDIIRNDIVNIIGTIIISPILEVIVGAWIGYIGAKYVITKCLQSTLIHVKKNESENWGKK